MDANNIKIISDELFYKAVKLIETAKINIVKSLNSNMVYTYFGIGRMIIVEEQNGQERAEYGKELIKNLSIKLLTKYKIGYSQRNLEQMRQFYLAYTKAHTLSADLPITDKWPENQVFILSWSH